MDAAQWAKDVTSDAISYNSEVVEEKKVKPQHEEALNCPRCNSSNTKFCYYNNYSLTQPRYFCKACKRYWTKGGSLRSVPVGGGSRKNKRSSSSSMPKPIDLSRFSSESYEPAYHLAAGFSQFLKLPTIENTITSNRAMSLVSTAHQDLNSTHSDSMFTATTTFGLQDFKPTLAFPFQGNGIKYGSFQGNQEEEEEEDGERIMLPFGDLNQQHSSRESGHNMGHGNSTGYWNENLGVGDSSTLYN